MNEKFDGLLEYMWEDPEGWGSELTKNVSMGQLARFILNRFNEVYPIHSDPIFLEAIYDREHRFWVQNMMSSNRVLKLLSPALLRLPDC
jgi:hypothetical protein